MRTKLTQITEEAEVRGSALVPCGDQRRPNGGAPPAEVTVGPKPPVNFGPYALWVNSDELIHLCVDSKWGSDVVRGWGSRTDENGRQLPSYDPYAATYYWEDGAWVPWFYGDGGIRPDTAGHYGLALGNHWRELWQQTEDCVFAVAKAIYHNRPTIKCPWSLGEKIVAANPYYPAGGDTPPN